MATQAKPDPIPTMRIDCSRPLARWLLLIALFLSAAALTRAQVAGSPGGEVIELPEFTVASDQQGWTAASSMSGTRTNVLIQNLPRSIQVLTSEFLADIGADTLSDAAAFMTGVVSQGKQDAVFDNNTFIIRGMRQNRHYRDGVRESFPGMISDGLSVDRVEILRGPSSLLAGVSEPGGMINQISKRPRNVESYAFKATIGSWDYRRYEGDVSMPLSERFAVRGAAAFQDSNSWRPWEGSERKVGYLAAAYRLGADTALNARAEIINYTGNVAIAIPRYRLPGATSSAPGYVPDEIAPWDFNPHGPNNLREHETYRASVDLQHRFNDTFSFRSAALWSKSDRRDHRLSANASVIYTRYLNPALGNVPGNVVPDEMRWSATLDDEQWEIFTYQTDFRGVFEYLGLKHEAILGLERIESQQDRERWDTPNATGNNPSSNPNALTRYKFPTAAVGPLPAGAFQPAWQQMTDVARYTDPNSYLDQEVTRHAISLTNVFSTADRRWHALAGVRADRGKSDSISGRRASEAVPVEIPRERATSETVGLLYRPVNALSVYASYSSSFSGVPAGFNVYDRPLVQPESGDSIEFGIKSSWLGGRLSLEAAVFELNRTNVRRQLTNSEIEAILGVNPGGARYTQDAGEKAEGFELQALIQPFSGYQIAASYAYVDAILTKTENVVRIGGPIAGRGKQNGSLFQKYTFADGSLKGLSITNGVVWVDGSRPDQISGSTGQVTNFMPGYVRVDAGLGYRFTVAGQELHVIGLVQNVGDKRFYEGLQSKGTPRNYRLSVSARF
jgi:iron complex outermembrane recepter protein